MKFQMTWLTALVTFAGTLLLPALNGTVQPLTFTGPVLGNTIRFSLYLPSGYSTPGNTNRYPVVYHLHGIGGSSGGQQTNQVPANHELAVAAGFIEPCIIVFPDGYTNSMWADGVSMAKPAETDLVQQLIPHIDANYRTLATRSRRAITGFSMGGCGAAKFAAKFPDTFAACVIYDGALHTWTTLNANHPDIVAEIFNGSEGAFNQFSPWTWTTTNVLQLRAGMRFRQVVAALTVYGRPWRDFVRVTNAISEPYVETGLPHSLGPIHDAEGTNSWH
jgi:enterochelin esterase-like enzyme